MDQYFVIVEIYISEKPLDIEIEGPIVLDEEITKQLLDEIDLAIKCDEDSLSSIASGAGEFIYIISFKIILLDLKLKK